MNSKETFQGTPEEWFQYIADFAVKIAMEIQKHLTNEQDLWWFVMEQYDWVMKRSFAESYENKFCLNLYKIEYEERVSENSYVGYRNPGICFLHDHVFPQLLERGSREHAELVLASVLHEYCRALKEFINGVRLKYATHFHNNCVSSGNYRSADRWNEVIAALAR